MDSDLERVQDDPALLKPPGQRILVHQLLHGGNRHGDARHGKGRHQESAVGVHKNQRRQEPDAHEEARHAQPAPESRWRKGEKGTEGVGVRGGKSGKG